MAHRNVGDAFGKGSPSCNLEFPNGNLTAVEILAYLPHWLKCIDVIKRFVDNGATASIIAAILNKHRDFPNDATFPSNSVTIMMQYAMRRVFNSNWTIGTHVKSNIEPSTQPGNLDVGSFRTPHVFVLKGLIDAVNRGGDGSPIEFRSLGTHVKCHPTGDDALDLTACVKHAIAHPHQSWLFPTDFQKLVKQLGGPKVFTCEHWDTQIFNRYQLGALRLSTAKKRVIESESETDTPCKRGCRSRLIQEVKLNDYEDTGKVNTDRVRKSRRLAGVPLKNLKEVESEDDDTIDALLKSDKRPFLERLIEADITEKHCGNITKANEPKDDGEWNADSASEASESFIETTEEDTNGKDIIDDYIYFPDSSPHRRPLIRRNGNNTPIRAAAKKSMIKTREMQAASILELTITKTTKGPEVEITPELASLATIYLTRPPPAFLQPLPLSLNGATIDAWNVHLYAEQHAHDPWTSAFGFYRFIDSSGNNAPRRNPPWRELHRLTEPAEMDTTEWAENVRWAKQQFELFGSVWTEYPYSLEVIGGHRREVLWVSEQAVRYGLSG
ncbi:hypothetical protein B0J11DRAFT_432081 [Dendryphion nanum]|uniref:Uncharacterized protein n=1 Tax=Dendryphion nanum TaxID=256645 RepID=A0A9P9IMQ0_9PLEO|nr:hypothetical protein B0J11DRAFT_432081 [Dendryphion nanum]